MMYDLISLVLAAVLIIWACTFQDRHRRRWQKKLMDHGLKVQGYVHFAKRRWLHIAGRRSSHNYELYAWFEYDGKSYQVMEKRRVKPRYKAGDPITICFDPQNPKNNMIMDFTEENEMSMI